MILCVDKPHLDLISTYADKERIVYAGTCRVRWHLLKIKVVMGHIDFFGLQLAINCSLATLILTVQSNELKKKYMLS